MGIHYHCTHYFPIMITLLNVLLQIGPPPPDDWGDPDTPDVPITDDIWILLVVLVLIGYFTLKSRIKKAPR